MRYHIKNLIRHITLKPYNGPEKFEKGVLYKKDNPLFPFYKKIQEIKKHSEVKEISKIEYKGLHLPIIQIDISPKAKTKIFILTGTHGDEHASLQTILEFINELRANSVLYSDYGFRIIGPHNPVGIYEQSRFNAEGYDLNRDFKQQKCKETRAVVAAFKEFKADLAINLHDGPQKKGLFFFGNKYIDRKFAEKLTQSLQNKDIELSSYDYFNKKLKTPGFRSLKGVNIILHCWSLFLGVEAFIFFLEKRNCACITLETSWLQSPEKRSQKQLIFLKTFIEIHKKEREV